MNEQKLAALIEEAAKNNILPKIQFADGGRFTPGFWNVYLCGEEVESFDTYYYTANAKANELVESLKIRIENCSSNIIKSLETEIESLKAQLEAKSKAPSHWDTAPEGAVKLVVTSGGIFYLNSKGRFWSYRCCKWLSDYSPHSNTLIDERTL